MQGVGGPRPPRLWDWAQRDRWEPQGQMLCGWMCGSLLSYVGKERRRQREKKRQKVTTRGHCRSTYRGLFPAEHTRTG